jgi:hypothetical protein
MRKEPQIFTSLQRQNQPVNDELLDDLEIQLVEESTLRQYVQKILREGIEFREVDSPLQYRHWNIKRIALCDTGVTDPPNPHDHYFAEIEKWRKWTKNYGRRLKKPVLDEVIPGVSDVCIIGFLDYHKEGVTSGNQHWYIDYMKTREDKGGEKVASRLIDKFYSDVVSPGDYVNFGKMMQPQIGHLKDKMAKKYPDIKTKGANYFDPMGRDPQSNIP